MRLSAVILLIIAGLSCNDNKPHETKSISLTDDLGVRQNFDQSPKRIISLAPNITEIIYAIGADTLLAGVTDICDHPPQVSLKPRIGSYLSPDLEKIMSLDPGLVIMYNNNTSNPAYNALVKSGIRVYSTDSKDIEGICKTIGDIGRITERTSKADSVINSIRQVIRSGDDDTGRASVFIVISSNPLMTAGGKTFISEIAGKSGFRNIFGDSDIEYPPVAAEDLLRLKPDFVLLPGDTTNRAELKRRADELSRTTSGALSSSSFLVVDEDLMFRPGPRVGEAVLLLRSLKGSMK